MPELWSNAIPQAMQQHGGISKNVASGQGELPNERRKAPVQMPPDMPPHQKRGSVKRARSVRRTQSSE